ncbi:MAG: sigma-70 family RNA polymerase sigma factor [Pseudomonadota bacterium]
MADLGAVLKVARPRALAALRRFSGNLERAEDAFQDAAEKALQRWPDDGVPDNPTGWLITTGKRLLIDQARRAKFELDVDIDAAAEDSPPDTSSLDDDVLRLIFTCCHPALSDDAQVALTLKVIAGLSSEDVAQAFLVPVRTMEQRLNRARSKIRNAGIPFRIPDDSELAERLTGVLGTLYLIFNQGYSARRDALTDARVCGEAIWLARLVRRLFPGHAEAGGLLALMLLHHSRHQARVAADGTPVRLMDQDRSAWQADLVDEGRALLQTVMAQHQPGPYQTQAAIAALHCAAGDIDWPQIAALYAILEQQMPSTVVSVNRAVALTEAGRADIATTLLRAVAKAPGVADYAPYHLALSNTAQATGDLTTAKQALHTAITLTPNDTERAFLAERLAQLKD